MGRDILFCAASNQMRLGMLLNIEKRGKKKEKKHHNIRIARQYLSCNQDKQNHITYNPIYYACVLRPFYQHKKPKV